MSLYSFDHKYCVHVCAKRKRISRKRFFTSVDFVSSMYSIVKEKTHTDFLQIAKLDKK